MHIREEPDLVHTLQDLLGFLERHPRVGDRGDLRNRIFVLCIDKVVQVHARAPKSAEKLNNRLLHDREEIAIAFEQCASARIFPANTLDDRRSIDARTSLSAMARRLHGSVRRSSQRPFVRRLLASALVQGSSSPPLPCIVRSPEGRRKSRDERLGRGGASTAEAPASFGGDAGCGVEGMEGMEGIDPAPIPHPLRTTKPAITRPKRADSLTQRDEAPTLVGMRHIKIAILLAGIAGFVACIDVNDEPTEADTDEGISSEGDSPSIQADDGLALEIDPQAASCGYSCSGGQAEQQMCCANMGGGSCIDIQDSHGCDNHFGGSGYFCTCHADRPWDGNWYTSGNPGTCAQAGLSCCGGDITCVEA